MNIVISENEKITTAINEINTKLKKNNKTFNELVEVELKDSISFENPNNYNSTNITPMGGTIYRTQSVSLQGKDIDWIPIISSGQVYGKVHYYTGVLGNPNAKFYFDYCMGHINRAGITDGIRITNVNEPYGLIWSAGTESTPYRRWNIEEYGTKSGSYYLKGTISYATLIKGLPVWKSYTVSKRLIR